MATQTTFWADLAAPSLTHNIQAQWFVIRLQPDLATGERLNIGVGVHHANQTHTKILPTAEPFRLLYGKTGLENFSFLLHIIRQNQTWETSPSPQISLSDLRMVKGASIQEILNRLYSDMVTLGNIKTPDKEKTTNIPTETLRQKIFSSLKKNDATFAEQTWHDESNPIYIEHAQGKIPLHHIQLWVPADITHPSIRFASFVSVDYQRTMFPELHLLQSSRDIQLAYTANQQTKKQAALWIYRPDRITQFDNHIDNTQWLLSKNLGRQAIRIEVENSMDKITQAVYEMAL